jgi:hypothetical protein
VSLFRLLLTCLWTASLGVFIVYLDAERIRMQSELLKWEELRGNVLEVRHTAVYDYWRTFQYAVPEGPLQHYLNERAAASPPAAEGEELQ